MKKVFVSALVVFLGLTLSRLVFGPVDEDAPIWLVVPIMVAYAISGLIVASFVVAFVAIVVDREY